MRLKRGPVFQSVSGSFGRVATDGTRVLKSLEDSEVTVSTIALVDNLGPRSGAGRYSYSLLKELVLLHYPGISSSDFESKGTDRDGGKRSSSNLVGRLNSVEWGLGGARTASDASYYYLRNRSNNQKLWSVIRPGFGRCCDLVDYS